MPRFEIIEEKEESRTVGSRHLFPVPAGQGAFERPKQVQAWPETGALHRYEGGD